MDKKKLKSVFIWLAISLTLGLAPFAEPHIIGKLKWITGGANGMKFMDWFDFLMHGTPWLMLIISILSLFKPKNTSLKQDI